MKSGKPIDISKSSLVSLKAELIRKKEEAEKLKGSQNFIKPPSKPKPAIKTNPGVSSRNEQDLSELTPDEVDLLQKSKDVLQIKSSLYDQLESGTLVSDDGKSRYLVDFENKEKTPGVSRGTEQPEQSSSQGQTDVIEVEEEDFEDDSDWVEYKDCLGRSRTCLRSDLPAIQDRDKALSVTLLKEPETQEKEEVKELVSDDMHLVELRKKWEEKEKELLERQNVHYEDILFDEARSHGVGYWKFSTDEAKRAEEQEMLWKVRNETEQKQKEAKALRDRREQQRQHRLIAARQRQRVRLGLPPIDASQILESSKSEMEKSPEAEEEVAEDLEVKLKKAAHVRPWDVGKDGVQQPVMSQEEWVEKKRKERVDEFAPHYSKASPEVPPSEPQRSTKQKKKRKKKLLGQILEEPLPDLEPTDEVNPMFSRTKDFLKKRKLQQEVYSCAGNVNIGAGPSVPRGVEVPPPTDFSYFTPNAPYKTKKSHSSFKDTADAIDAGLKLLREQAETLQETSEHSID